ncbi:MAG: hypothetical protein M1839_000429 [Geoglossum umbratile]|nr:MAG: hypothetical protein M1839_000429 [Geoglossum umbratile]
MPPVNTRTPMIELSDILTRLGLSQYFEPFVQEGFDTWETVLDITESDLESLNVRLGHRRVRVPRSASELVLIASLLTQIWYQRLQREIASARGQSAEQPLGSPTRPLLTEKAILVREERASSIRGEFKGNVGGGKRKYRRHPKVDENAPERASSAYVIFSNKIREDVKDQNLSFTEIAKLVGESWQLLPAVEKESYESQALAAKERYNAELTEYKKTAAYIEYTKYLVEFKAKLVEDQVGMVYVH